MQYLKRLPVALVTFLLIVGMSLACCSGCYRIEPPKNPETALHKHLFVNKLKDSTLTLLNRVSSGEYISMCGGVWVSGSDIITAKHCVVDEDNPQEEPTDSMIPFESSRESNLETKNFNPHFARVIAVDDKSDLALLRSDQDLPHSFAHVASDQILLGGTLHIVGHPVGLEYTYMTGIVSAKREFTVQGEHIKVMQVQAPVWIGNSGGPAFDDSGNIVGIASRAVKTSPNVGIFVPNIVIKNFLRRESSAYSL